MIKFIRVLILIFILNLYFSINLLSQKKSNKTDSEFKFMYSEALRLKTNTDYELSIKYFEKCLNLNENSSASAFQLSLLYIQTHKIPEAEFYINYALKINKTNEWYILQRAFISKLQGDTNNYKISYEDLVKYYPNNQLYSYELAMIYYRQNKFKKSLELLTKLEIDLGVNENISFIKNNIFLEQKEYLKIENELKKLIDNYQDSLKYIDMLGEYYLSMGHNNKALEIYSSAQIKFPTNKRISIKLSKIYASISEYSLGYKFLIEGIGSPGVDSLSQYNISKLYIDNSEIGLQKKITIYKKLISYFTYFDLISNSYIQLLINEKEISLAETEINNLFKYSVNNYQLWNFIFTIYLQQNRIEELNITAIKALDYFPSQATVYFYIGYSYFMLKEYTKASSNLLNGIDYIIEDKALELNFYLYLAESFHALNNDKKSDLYFDKYLSLDSTNAYLLNNYAYYLSKRVDKLNKAFGLSLKSIEIEPLNPSFLDTYAWIYYLKMDFKNALFYIEKAYKYGGSTNSVICEHFGDIYLKNDRVGDAIEKWQESFKLNKSNPTLKKKIELYN